jgi:hypothetical protein
MGAFILIKKSNGVGIEEIEKQYHDSLDVFNKMGLRLNQKIVNDELVIYVFHKYNFTVDNFVRFDNSQFIISTGTLIYNRKIARDALEELFHDFSEDGKFLANTLGHYCLIIFKKGKLYLFNDYPGLYHVFSNKNKSIISNSFLAVLKTLNEKNVSTQGLFEYVIHGACFGDATLVNEIGMLDSKKIWQLSPNVSAIPRPLYIKRLDRTSSFNGMVEEIATDLVDYFSIIKANFSNSICSALSGGVHTRLMLGLMRKVGIKPNYLYVYGDEKNTAGRDANIIQIVKAIAEGEGLSIEHLNRDKFPRFTEDEYEKLLEKRYYLGDGLGHEIGLFDNGADLYYRLSRTEKGRLQINGGGGEVFRNYWKLPDKSYHIRSFFKVRYDRMDYSIFTDCFDYDSHFSALQDKIKISLGIDKDRINRSQIELLQPEFDNKYWMGSNNSINNLLSYSLTPFGDTPFQYRGCDIPLKCKNFYTFESALMKFIDPDLARYPTSHGIDLFNNRFKLSAKIRYLVTLNTPLWLKAYIRKHFWYQKSELFRLHGNKSDLPFFLNKKYLDRIFRANSFCMSQYVHIDKITNPEVLSRVLTAELVISDRF